VWCWFPRSDSGGALRRRSLTPSFRRIRELDTKAEHYERQIHRLEQERDEMEKKYEVRHSSYVNEPDRPLTFQQDAVKKYQTSQAELDALVRNLDSL
jgi:tropomyosin